MSLPKFLQPYLASYDVSRLDLEVDKRLIITQILNWGDTKATKWLLNKYEFEDLKEVVAKPARGMWTPKALSYWQKILDVDVSASEYQSAIMDVNPQPELYGQIIP